MKETFHLLVRYPNACTSQDWARPDHETRAACRFPMGTAGSQLLGSLSVEHIYKKVGRKWKRDLNTDPNTESGVLNATANTHLGF